MDKKTNIIISLIITFIFALASYFGPLSTNLFWTVCISVMTFFLSYVSIELEGHVRILNKDKSLDKYKRFASCGIADFYKDFTNIDFTESIRTAKTIRMVVMYSRGFVNNNLVPLRDFLSRSGTNLEIIMINPDPNKFVYKYLSDKYGYNDEKIAESIQAFKNCLYNDLLPYKNSGSSMTVYYTTFLPAYSLFMFDDIAYITLYKTAPHRTSLIPSFKIEKAQDASFFTFLKADFDELTIHQQTKKANIE